MNKVYDSKSAWILATQPENPVVDDIRSEQARMKSIIKFLKPRMIPMHPLLQHEDASYLKAGQALQAAEDAISRWLASLPPEVK